MGKNNSLKSKLTISTIVKGKVFMLSHRLGHEVQSLQIQTTAVLILTLCLLLGCAHHQPSQLTTSNNQHSVLSPEIAPQPSKTMQAEQDNTVLSKKFSITGSNLPVKDIVLLMARDSALSVDIHPSIQARVTLHTQQQSMQQILDRICRQANCIYRLEVNSGILIIEPDLPILKHYKIDYVNLERDTKGGISVTNQLASTQVSLRNSPASASSNTQQNNSSTSVSTLSTHHFWKSLIKNIEEILEETDKQILIKRLEFDARLQADYAFDFEQVKQSQSKETKLSDTQKNSNENSNKNEGANEFKDSDKKLKSYRTLFASKIIAHRESGVISIRTTHQLN